MANLRKLSNVPAVLPLREFLINRNTMFGVLHQSGEESLNESGY